MSPRGGLHHRACYFPLFAAIIPPFAAVFSLASGAVLDVGICRYAGKGQNELGMLRTLWNLFLPGDVVLADRLMCAWTEMVMLKQRGVDCVCRSPNSRFSPWKTSRPRRSPCQMAQADEASFYRPGNLRNASGFPHGARMSRPSQQPGFRIKTLIIATTLLDADEFTKDDLVQLYRARWNGELDLRSLKQTMQMDVLRCKTPELVRKELWTHILAYNLIRTIMAQAATKHGIEPRYQQVLDAIATHRVADRPRDDFGRDGITSC